MLAVLEFVFSDFWHFLGMLVLVLAFTIWQPISIRIEKGDRE